MAAGWSFLTHNKGQHSCLCATEEIQKMMVPPVLRVFGRKRELVDVCAYFCVFITSAVRPLVPAIGAVGDSVTQFAHMDTHIQVQTSMFIDRTLVHSVVCAWNTSKTHKETKQYKAIYRVKLQQINYIQWYNEHIINSKFVHLN